jgi:hypothetical protein
MYVHTITLSRDDWGLLTQAMFVQISIKRMLVSLLCGTDYAGNPRGLEGPTYPTWGTVTDNLSRQPYGCAIPTAASQHGIWISLIDRPVPSEGDPNKSFTDNTARGVVVDFALLLVVPSLFEATPRPPSDLWGWVRTAKPDLSEFLSKSQVKQYVGILIELKTPPSRSQPLVQWLPSVNHSLQKAQAQAEVQVMCYFLSEETQPNQDKVFAIAGSGQYYQIGICTRKAVYRIAEKPDNRAEAQELFLEYSRESVKLKPPKQATELARAREEVNEERDLRNSRWTAYKILTSTPEYQENLEILGQMVPPFSDGDINRFQQMQTSQDWLEDPQIIFSQEAMIQDKGDLVRPINWLKPMSLMAPLSKRSFEFMQECMTQWMDEWGT